MPQPIPIRTQQQSQPTPNQVPRQDAVFDPDKSRAARQLGKTSPQAQKSEERFRLEGESEPPASVIGGVGGRPMSRRETKLEAIRDDAMDYPADGRMTGTNRSPKVLQKNRKRRAA